MDKFIQDYKSRRNDPASKKLGTFSYLPKMHASAIRQQLQYMVKRGWNCAVEHVEPERAMSDYWYMWKLPMFGERNLDTIMGELNACRNANPDDYIRVIGYDNKRQSQGQSMVVYRGRE
jgi:ribulose-bisphosphate carboxylase small chain